MLQRLTQADLDPHRLVSDLDSHSLQIGRYPNRMTMCWSVRFTPFAAVLACNNKVRYIRVLQHLFPQRYTCILLKNYLFGPQILPAPEPLSSPSDSGKKPTGSKRRRDVSNNDSAAQPQRKIAKSSSKTDKDQGSDGGASMTSSDSPPSSPPVLSPQETRSKSALSQSAKGTITTSSSPQATDSGKRDLTATNNGSETAQATVTAAAQSDNDDDDDVMIVAPAAERDNDNDSCSGSSNALDRVHRVKIGQSDVTVNFPVKLHAKFDHG